MNHKELVYQLFIGKVSDIIGLDKASELFEESKAALSYSDDNYCSCMSCEKKLRKHQAIILCNDCTT